MARSTIQILQPGSEGLVTDISAEHLRAGEAAEQKDGYIADGLLTQVRGWEYDATPGGNSPDSLGGVARLVFPRLGTAKTVRTGADSAAGNRDPLLYVDDQQLNPTFFNILPSSLPGSPEAAYLPRAVYNGELLLCANGHRLPVVRYAGSEPLGNDQPTTWQVAAGEPRITATAGAFGADVDVGSYIVTIPAPSGGGGAGPWHPAIWIPVSAVESTTSIGLYGAKTESTTLTGSNFAGFIAQDIALSYPCIETYSEGLVEIGAFGTPTANINIIDGTGVDWSVFSSMVWGSLRTRVDATTYRVYNVKALPNDQTIHIEDNTVTSVVSDVPLSLMERMPFVDVAVFQGSLYGVRRDSTRLYYGPPGWNLSYPPGFEVDPRTGAFFQLDDHADSVDPLDFEMDYVPVPADLDDDYPVALLEADTRLILVKDRSIYSVYGGYPAPRYDLIAKDAGGLDRNGTYSGDLGVFVAGNSGIWHIRGSDVRDITRGREDEDGPRGIHDEWRRYVAPFDADADDYICIARDFRHILVSASIGADQRTYIFDTSRQVWSSRHESLHFKTAWEVQVPGEDRRTITMDPADTNAVQNISPMFQADAANVANADGTEPLLTYHGPSGLARLSGAPEVLTRMLEATFHVTLDAPSRIEPSVVAAGLHRNSAGTVTKTLPEIVGSATPDEGLVRANERVGIRRHTHQVRMEKLTNSASETTTVLRSMRISFRAPRRAL